MLKKVGVIVFTLVQSFIVVGQEIPLHTEQQLENQTDATQEETEDDTYWQELEQFKKNPVNINTAEEDELKQLRLLSDLQIHTLITYRHLLGKLINLYELQSIPGWDIGTIKKILPFVSVSIPVSVTDIKNRFSGGEHTLLLRVSQVLEKAKGFDNSNGTAAYKGSPQRIFFRYRYTYKNLLQFGVLGDKDAGEQFFSGAQKKGFDFYSAHLFARKLGLVEALALGDFTVNMGQGLVQWQGLAFKKSAAVLGVKRQSAVLRPYSSAGEFYFHRGAGITLRKKQLEATAFISFRQLNANVTTGELSNEDVVSSFLTSGLNRTDNELSDKNRLAQITFGGNIIYRGAGWHAGVNSVAYQFSLPVQKRDEPYNLYALSGRQWYNTSIDYSYTYKNIHFFGEAAVDKNTATALINGMLLSVDTRVDVTLLHRKISKAYQAINGNAFTENTNPANETGLYAGICIRPSAGWRIDAYGDIYTFPWLKYLVDGPSRGSDFLAQLTYTPNRQVEVYSRFRTESKQGNQGVLEAEGRGMGSATNYLAFLPKKSWRTQVGYKVNSVITIRNRVEMLWYDKKGPEQENGFLIFFDLLYKPMLKPLSGVLRLQYFETGGYNSRLYAYENDVLYSYSIPAFFDQGYRYYLIINAEAGKKLSFWLRWGQTILQNRPTSGSGMDEIPGNKRTELKLQVRWVL
ncbi:MAG: helix-hairpin-helix domain-containing protein [Chitinophagaceae bacterium]|nr:helix-hairpin-helix domain-containing protein [Chitinophagaceae bacterium]